MMRPCGRGDSHVAAGDSVRRYGGVFHAILRRRHHEQQRQLERGVSAELFDRTDHVPDDLRANLAVAIIS
jgi:hypothetical protein